MRLNLPKPGPERRLALLAIANSLVLTLLPSDFIRDEFRFVFVAGLAAADSVLLAIWIAWGPAPTWKRLGIAFLLVGLPVYIELMLDGLGFGGFPGATFSIAHLLIILLPIFVALLVPLRDCLGCEFLVGRQPSLHRPRLQIRNHFVWILLIAMPLGYLRWLGGSANQPLLWLSMGARMVPFIFIVATICVTCVFAGKRWYLWSLGGVGVIFLLAWGEETAICHSIRYFRDPQGAWPGYQDLRAEIRVAHFSLVATLMLNLVILRLIGIRIFLTRPRLNPHSTTIAPQPSNVMPNVAASS